MNFSISLSFSNPFNFLNFFLIFSFSSKSNGSIEILIIFDALFSFGFGSPITIFSILKAFKIPNLVK